MVVLGIYIQDGGSNCYSSKDFKGYRVVNSVEEAKKFIIDNDFAIEDVINDKELDLNYFILKGYNYGYRLGECRKLFATENPDIIKLYNEKELNNRSNKRKEEGYVCYKRYDYMKPEDYNGSLNKLLTDYVLNYLNGIPFGYLGHASRKHFMDKIIEDVCEEIAKERYELDGTNIYQCVSYWLCSSGARHWLDNHEDDNEEKFKNAVIKEMKEMIAYGFGRIAKKDMIPLD